MPPSFPDIHVGFAQASVWAAERLERDASPDPSRVLRPFGEMAARMFARMQLGRAPIDIPMSVSAVGIGGATLGGSYKTPLAIACARALSAAGAKVAFVGHGYGARPGRARIVEVCDSVSDVGDEALLAAHELAALGVEVIVARTRAEAIAFAAQRCAVLVIDGTANLRGGRSLLRVLSVSARTPWGSREVFPLGDLRATPAELRAGVDVVAPVHLLLGDDENVDPEIAAHATLVLPEACTTVAPPSERRVGVLTAISRPTRFVECLERLGVHPRVILRAPDHDARSAVRRALRLSAQNRLDYWVTTSKCSLSLENAWLGAPRHRAELRLALAPTFASRLLLLGDGP